MISSPQNASTTPGRVVVLTGAASGIGAATAAYIADASRHLILIDRDPKVEEIAATLVGRFASITPVVLDLGDIPGLQSSIDQIGSYHGRLDVLINNAGIHPKQDGKRFTVEEITLDQWQHVIDVNLTAPFLLAKHAFSHMKRERWGRIVNIASRAGRTFISEGSAHYSSTKAGLIGLTRLLAGEGGPFGITSNCVAPGRVVTPLSSQGVGVDLHERFKSTVPVGRVGHVDEVAAAIAFYISEDAGFTTGTVLDVNGGGFMG